MNNLQSISTVIAMCIASISSSSIAQSSSAALNVSFTGIEEKEGAILGAVFNSEDAYNGKGAPVRQIMISADKSEVATALEGLEPGVYAIKAFHDIDGDMKMSTNPYGMPIEPFAFSNNAPAQGGPAKWQAASFAVDGSEAATAITIR
jgi:uncharacterized protein (DUF2141 family)